MFQGLTLDQAPPYHIPMKFYRTAAFYLVALCLAIFIYGVHISSRLEYESIAITHIFTLGFITHVMFGSLFQMLPVMLSSAYLHVKRNAQIIYILLNTGTLFFVIGLFINNTLLLYGGITALASAFLYFCIISLQTVFTLKDKNILLQNFLASFVALFFAALFGVIAFLGLFGFNDSVLYGNIHMAWVLFGWVFILVMSVSYKIIPMFFVAKEFPRFLQTKFYILQLLLLFLFTIAQIFQYTQILTIIKILLSFTVIIFAFYSIKILKQRKRARADVSVKLWYFAMGNIILAAFIYITATLFHRQFSFEIGFLALFGGVYALINAMLYKIIPFLTWFHLSSNMVFEAEMGNVISKKDMTIQTNCYFISFGVFLLIPFSHYFLLLGTLIFLCSSILLLKNILAGEHYYNNYIKKKVVFE
jgi:hypothetical protein